MRRRSPLVLSISCSCLLLLGLMACTPASPEEQVAKTRSQYTVKFNAWALQQSEPAQEAAAEGDVAGEGEATAAAVGSEEEGEEGEVDLSETLASINLGPQSSDILFDLLVRFEGSKPLPGITVEVTHADPFEKEKENRLHYIETDSFVGTQKTQQVSFVLEGFEYEDGDVFSVEFNAYVSPEERGGYREFAEGAP